MVLPAYPTPFEVVAQARTAVASVDHRLSGEALWPEQLPDVKSAVRWLRPRAGELGIDPDRIAAWANRRPVAGGPTSPPPACCCTAEPTD